MVDPKSWPKKDPQQVQAEHKAFREQTSGRNNGLVRAGEGVSTTGVGMMQGNWIVGTAVAGVGMGMKGGGYIQEGKTAKGFACIFGGHVGESVAEKAEGDSAGEIAERRMGIMMAGASTGAGAAMKSSGKAAGGPSNAGTGTVEASAMAA